MRSAGVQPSTTAVRNLSTDDDARNRCMSKLSDCVVDRILRDGRTGSESVDRHDHHLRLRRSVEQRLMRMIPDLFTPSHPTYAYMIRKAITDLNAEGGSDKEAISKFIQTEFTGLPLAHEKVMRLHLSRLYEKGEIVLSELGCYALSVGDNGQDQHNGKEQAKKKDGGGSEIKCSDFKETEAVAVDDPAEVNVWSTPVQCKQNQDWSIRLQSEKPQEDGTNGPRIELVEDPLRIAGQSEAINCHRHPAELLIADQRLEDQLLTEFDEPLEPPGFPSMKDRLFNPWSQMSTSDPEMPIKSIPSFCEASELKAHEPSASTRLPKPKSIGKINQQKEAVSWEWEVIATHATQQSSKFGDNNTLAIVPASQDNKGTTGKRQRVGRPPKLDKGEKHSESKDSTKVKRGRGRPIKR